MAEQPKRVYNEAVMRFIRNTNPSEDTLQRWEIEHPNLRFRDYGYDRTGPLANINKAVENFMYGRAYDREELPDAMRRQGWMNLFNGLNSLRPGRALMNRFSPAGVQDNIRPGNSQSSFVNPMDINNLGMTAFQPPSSQMLRLMSRMDARNSMRTSSMGEPVSMRVHPLDEYAPAYENQMLSLDRLLGNRGGPGGNILVPANRTQTQEYTAAQIIQKDPELARHLGLLKSLRGD